MDFYIRFNIATDGCFLYSQSAPHSTPISERDVLGSSPGAFVGALHSHIAHVSAVLFREPFPVSLREQPSVDLRLRALHSGLALQSSPVHRHLGSW